MTKHRSVSYPQGKMQSFCKDYYWLICDVIFIMEIQFTKQSFWEIIVPTENWNPTFFQLIFTSKLNTMDTKGNYILFKYYRLIIFNIKRIFVGRATKRIWKFDFPIFFVQITIVEPEARVGELIDYHNFNIIIVY